MRKGKIRHLFHNKVKKMSQLLQKTIFFVIEHVPKGR